MKRATQISRAVSSVFALAAIVASCSRQHAGPEVGDSVTNWLRSCARDRDCTGSASCINELCNVSCSTAAHSCTALNPDAICDDSVRACDLPCQRNEQCDALGAGFGCLDGRCRELLASATDSPVSSDRSGPFSVIPLPSEAPAPTDWMTGSISAGRKGKLDTTQSMPLSDPSDLAQDPTVRWEDDSHWRVAWRVDKASTSSVTTEFVRIFPTGDYESQRNVNTIEAVASLTRGLDSAVALSGRGADGRCSLNVTDLDSSSANTPTYFACQAPAAAAPIRNSREWIVTWLALSVVEDVEQGLLVARYDPAQVGFSAGPWQVGSYLLAAGTGAAAQDLDGWAWATTNLYFDLYRITDIALPTSYPRTQIPTAISLDGPSTNVRDIVSVSDGVLVLDSTAEGFRARAIRSHSEETRARTLSSGAIAAVRAVSLPERAEVAACVLTSDQVIVYLLDESGAPIDERSQTLAAGRTPESCDLAWSGSELLVAWGESDNVGAFDLSPGAPVYEVFAKIVRLDGSKLSP